jgi:hypothetical protein
MKRCSTCKEEKDELCFSWKNKAKGVLCTQCKICQRTYSKQHYQSNKQEYIDRSKRDAKKVYSKLRELIHSLKLVCSRCDETHPAALDFHHTDPTQKDFEISSCGSRKRVLAEINKCIVLCANCHRKLHYNLEVGVDC